MDSLNTVLLLVGLIVLIAGLYWLFIERVWLTPPLLATVFGVLVGPAVAAWADPWAWGVDPMWLLEEVTRVTLAVSLAAIAVHLPADYVRRNLSPLLIVAVGGTLLMWLACGVVLAAVAGLAWTPALLIGAALAPTDPVLAGTVVTGRIAQRNIPSRLRHLLYAESAANDGLAWAVVMLPAMLWTHQGHDAGVWGHWLTHTLLWEVICGAALGAAAGFLVGWLQKLSQRWDLSDPRGMLPVILALALGVLGGLKLLGTDALLAVFVAAVTFHIVARDALEGQQEHIQDAMQRFFQLPTFVLLGAMLPWEQWAGLGWTGAAVVAGILLLRRWPAWLLLKPVVKPMHHWRDAAFLGWFGPIGISAIYYAAVAHRHTHHQSAWPLITLVVAASILIHGLTATPATHWMGRHEPAD